MRRSSNDFGPGKESNMTIGKTSRVAPLHRSIEGSALVELALILPVLFLLLAGIVEFGWMLYIAIQVSNASQAGAIYGTMNPTDVSGITTATQNGSANLSGLTVAVSYGCECSDGSSAVASCTAPPTCPYNYVNYVDVTASAPYAAFVPLPGLPPGGNVSSEARMRVGGD
jgi:Flp pilus assembly protein TadG